MRRAGNILFVVAVLWGIWTLLGRSYDDLPVEPVAAMTQPLDSNSLCERNIVGIQPYMVPSDYLSEERFYHKLNGYFSQARNEGYFRSNTVVLLPEYLGTWLVVAGEKASVAELKTITGAMSMMVISNPLKTLWAVFRNQGESDRVAAAIFRMKSRQMAAIYTRVFSRLAKDYGVTINAGSIVLPGPQVAEGIIQVDISQPLYNTTFIFHPFGVADGQMVRKAFPISSELPFVCPAPVEEIPLFELPIGKTALLVCADSWYPESYARIKELGAEVILVNSYLAGQGTMSNPWHGYDGSATPPDVDPAHVETITEREAWIAYALPGRIGSSGARIGVNVFLRGELWDLGADGQPLIVRDGALLPVTVSDTAGIWNLCF
ncbi:MAG: carbon-nitrogen hydrolase [Cyclobacteriaceae bacterium]|nr:carbon-nitrogen hydrolase [Cyclobacteriaceae bacterium]